MSLRKVQSIRNSFYVYLPKLWCQTHGINKKSEIRINEMEDGSLTILPFTEISTPQEQAIIDVDNQSWETAPVLLVAAYIAGLNQVEIRSKKPFPLEWRERLITLSRKLLGFEVMVESDNSLLIEDVSTSYELLPILRREFISVKYMLDGVKSCLATNLKQNAEVVINRDDDVDRYRYAVERLSHIAIRNPMIRMKVKVTPQSCLHYSIAAKYLERMADHATGIAQETINGKSVSKEFINVLDQITKLYDTVTKEFFSKRSTKVERIIGSSVEIMEQLRVLELRQKSSAARIISFHLDRILAYCSDLAEVAIDLHFLKTVAL